MNERRTFSCAAAVVLFAACISNPMPVRADDETDGMIETAVAAVGEVLAMGDLCDWNFSGKVDRLLQDGAKALQLNAAQQKDMRARIAAARRETFGRFSASGQARLRADICKPEERGRLETMIGRISFE